MALVEMLAQARGREGDRIGRGDGEGVEAGGAGGGGEIRLERGGAQKSRSA
jgi:hypothetical protein